MPTELISRIQYLPLREVGGVFGDPRERQQRDEPQQYPEDGEQREERASYSLRNGHRYHSLAIDQSRRQKASNRNGPGNCSSSSTARRRT